MSTARERAARFRETRWNLYAFLAPFLIFGAGLLAVLSLHAESASRWAALLAAAAFAAVGLFVARRKPLEVLGGAALVALLAWSAGPQARAILLGIAAGFALAGAALLAWRTTRGCDRLE